MKKLTLLLLLTTLLSFGQFNNRSIKEVLIEAFNTSKTFSETHNIPGMSIAVSKNGTTIWVQGFGYSDLENGKSVNAEQTKFRIASISKSLTAAALGKLVDANKLILDESIYTYVPDFPKKTHDFTVRQVAGHIAGIRHYKGNEFIMNKDMDIVEGLDVFKNDPLEFMPGSQYKYSTYGWNLLSVVVQNASEQDFNSYMEKEIFEPLSMTHTKLEKTGKDFPELTVFYRKTKNDSIIISPEVKNEFKAAGGGFLSTATDLVKFGNEMINPQLLSYTTVKDLVTSLKTSDGELTNYGVGFGIGQSLKKTIKYSHSGGGIGATTLLLMYPEDQIVISILTNLERVPIRDLGDQLEKIFLD